MIYIHIGLPKTGSTTLQNLFCTLGATGESEVIYPQAGRLVDQPNEVIEFRDGRNLKANCCSSNHTLIYHALAGHLIPTPASHILQSLQDEVAARPNDKFILSSEGFSGLDRAIPRFLDILEGHKVCVIVYVRDPQRRVVSSYRECVRTQNCTQTFEQFLKSRIGKLLQEPAIIARWANYAGRDNVVIKNFDQIVQTSGLVEDMAATLQISTTIPDQETANSSLDDRSLKTIRLLSKVQSQFRNFRIPVLIAINLKRAVEKRSNLEFLARPVGWFSKGPLIPEEELDLLKEMLQSEYRELSPANKAIYEQCAFDKI